MRPRLCPMRFNSIDDLFFALPAEPDDVNVRLKRAVALASRRVVVGGDFSKSTSCPCQCQPLEARQFKLIYDSFVPNQIEPEVLQDIVERETQIENLFNTFRADFEREKGAT